MKKRKVVLFLLLMVFVFTSICQSNDFPSEPIRLIVPYTAGGGTDRIARAFAGVAGGYSPVPIQVITMPGGGAADGTRYVVNSIPDGYTLSIGSFGSAIGPAVLRDVGYTPHDLKGVAQIAEIAQALVIHPESKWDLFEDFVEDAKNNPGKYTYATPGAGSFAHFTVEALCEKLGLDLLHIPHDSGAEAVFAVAGGHVDLASGSIGSMVAPHNAGTVRAIVQTGSIRESALDDVPTVLEEGYDFSFFTSRGIWAPKDVPNDRIAWLSELARKTLEDDSYISLANLLGDPPTFIPAEEFTDLTYEYYEIMSRMTEMLY